MTYEFWISSAGITVVENDGISLEDENVKQYNFVFGLQHIEKTIKHGIVAGIIVASNYDVAIKLVSSAIPLILARNPELAHTAPFLQEMYEKSSKVKCSELKAKEWDNGQQVIDLFKAKDEYESLLDEQE